MPFLIKEKYIIYIYNIFLNKDQATIRTEIMIFKASFFLLGLDYENILSIVSYSH